MTKLSGAVDTIEGNCAIQTDLDKLEKWAHLSLMRFNKEKYMLLHLSWNNPKYVYRLGEELNESSPAVRDLGLLGDEKLDIRQHCIFATQKYPGLHCKEVANWEVGGEFPPLFCLHVAPTGVLL